MSQMTQFTPTEIPVGTHFFVHNGNWYGTIIEENGQRYMQCFADPQRTHLVNTVLLSEDEHYDLTITIQK